MLSHCRVFSSFSVKLFIIALLASHFTVALPSFAEWIVRKDAKTAVVANPTKLGLPSINFQTKGISGVVAFEASSAHGESELVVTFSAPVSFAFRVPSHFERGTKYIYNLVETAKGKERIDLGDAKELAPGVQLTRYGYLTIGEDLIVFASGLTLVVKADGSGTAAIFPRGKSFGSTVDTLQDAQQKELNGLVDFIRKDLSRAKFPAISTTNFDSNVLTEEAPRAAPDFEVLSENKQSSLVAPAPGDVLCSPLPPCCCSPEELAEDGNCYRVHLVIPGAGSSGSDGTDSGTTAGKVKKLLEDAPCSAPNTHIFPMPPGNRNVKTELLVQWANKMTESCPKGTKINVHAHCYGGGLVYQGMSGFDPVHRWNLEFWSVPFHGGSLESKILLNVLPMGLGYLIMSQDQINVAYNTDESEMNLGQFIPDHVELMRFFRTMNDTFVDVDSQVPNLDEVNTNPKIRLTDLIGNGHFDGMRDRFLAPYCCGDGKRNGFEHCEGEGSSCAGPHNPRPEESLWLGKCKECRCVRPLNNIGCDCPDQNGDSDKKQCTQPEDPEQAPRCPPEWELKKSDDSTVCWCELAPIQGPITQRPDDEIISAPIDLENPLILDSSESVEPGCGKVRHTNPARGGGTARGTCRVSLTGRGYEK